MKYLYVVYVKIVSNNLNLHNKTNKFYLFLIVHKLTFGDHMESLRSLL
jgi:hypothetical protein